MNQSLLFFLMNDFISSWDGISFFVYYYFFMALLRRSEEEISSMSVQGEGLDQIYSQDENMPSVSSLTTSGDSRSRLVEDHQGRIQQLQAEHEEEKPAEAAADEKPAEPEEEKPAEAEADKKESDS